MLAMNMNVSYEPEFDKNVYLSIVLVCELVSMPTCGVCDVWVSTAHLLPEKNCTCFVRVAMAHQLFLIFLLLCLPLSPAQPLP